MSASLACAQGTTTSIEERLQRLEAEQSAMKQQLAERDAADPGMKRELQAQGGAAAPAAATAAAAGGSRAGAAPRGAAAVATAARGAGRGRRSEAAATPQVETWGVYDPGKGFLVGRSELRRARHQRLRHGSLHEPARRRPGIHRPSRQRACGRPARRHFFAPDHGVPEGLDGQREAHLQHHALDGEHDRPGCDVRQHRVPVQPEVQPLRRPHRQPGIPVAERLASLLARARSRHGGRVLPAVFRFGHLCHRRSGARPLVHRRRLEQQQLARHEGEPARPQVHLRRHSLVDADDARVRPAWCIRRLGMARGARDAVRHVIHSRARNRASAIPAAPRTTPRCDSPTA